MNILSIGYVGLDSPGLDAWEALCTRLLACPFERVVRPDGGKGLNLRLDEKCQRVLLREAPTTGNAFLGFELADGAALAQAAAELAAAGVATHAATAAELATRRVAGMLHCVDPSGYRVELYHGLAEADAPFVPPRPMGGFRAGALGFGHAVLVAAEFDRTRDFYCTVLGCRISDHINEPNRRIFLHVNGRHHSLALADRKGFGIAHLMFEVNQFDDLGRAWDICQLEYRERIFSTLGRHSNDHMTSFYVDTPARVPIEYGWGGLTVDDATWQVREVFGPSLWGHDRVGQPPAARRAADAQRWHAYELGLAAPIHVRPGDAAFALDPS